MSERYISLDNLKEYNKQMKETYIEPLESKVAEAEGRITVVTFDITQANTEVNFIYGLPGMTKIDWGDGTINSELSHIYIESGQYFCKIHDVTELKLNVYGPPNSWMPGVQNITALHIGNTVTTLLGLYQTKITNLIIPDSVDYISSIAFQNCSSLTKVVISDSVTSIGHEAFGGCSSLTSVIIGDGVTSIGDYAFRNCSSLTSVNIPNSVTVIDGHAFSGCSGLISVNISDSVTSINEYAFEGCSSLTSVVIGDSVTDIGKNAFNGCRSLMEITFKSENPIILPHEYYGPDTGYKQSVFVGCDALVHIYVPYGTSKVYKTTWSTYGIEQDFLDKIIESDREAMMADLNALETSMQEYVRQYIADNFATLMEQYLASNSASYDEMTTSEEVTE